VIPEFAAGFDGALVKGICGYQFRQTRKERFHTLGIGVKVFPVTWLSVAGYIPHRSIRAEYEPSQRDISVDVWGDPTLSATFDLFELLRPSMVVVPCPETGGPILALKDDDSLIKAPHLSISGGVSFPLATSSTKTHGWLYPPQYQPGSGVWSGSIGLFYSQGIGPVTPAIGATCVFGGRPNEAGYDKPDSLVASASTNWLFWYQRRGNLFLGANWLQPLGKGEQHGKSLSGSDRRLVSMDMGISFWVASLPSTNKIMAGLIGTLPVDEGSEYTEPRIGASLGTFLVYGW